MCLLLARRTTDCLHYLRRLNSILAAICVERCVRHPRERSSTPAFAEIAFQESQASPDLLNTLFAAGTDASSGAPPVTAPSPSAF
jgi:hypothetical protein